MATKTQTTATSGYFDRYGCDHCPTKAPIYQAENAATILARIGWIIDHPDATCPTCNPDWTATARPIDLIHIEPGTDTEAIAQLFRSTNDTLTRPQIADIIGIAPNNVSSYLSKLKQRGVIRQVRGGWQTIQDPTPN